MNLLRNLLIESRRLHLEQDLNARMEKPFYVLVNVRPQENKMLVSEFKVCLN